MDKATDVLMALSILGYRRLGYTEKNGVLVTESFINDENVIVTINYQEVGNEDA